MKKLKLSNHFLTYSLKERDYLTIEMCENVVNFPIDYEIQNDGRIRLWGFISEHNKYLRVVLENDGETILTAHFDRNFKKNMELKI